MTDLVAIGWDVAGWKSRNHALVAIAHSHTGTLRYLAPPQGPGQPGLQGTLADVWACLQAWTAQCPNVVLALDAPLSNPSAFRDFVRHPEYQGKKPYEDLAYREIDLWVKENLVLNPLSASMSYLGAPATVAQHHTQLLRQQGYHWLPVDAATHQRKSIVEAYPAAYKKLPDAQHHAIKALLAQPWRDSYEMVYEGKKSKQKHDNHLLDAALCALVALLVGGAQPIPGLSLTAPSSVENNIQKAEGWIYCPTK